MAVSRVSTSSVLQGFPKSRSLLAGNSAYLPPSYESIATVTGSGSSGTVTFSSIPSTYTHLQIRYIAKSTQGGTAASYIPTININGSAASAYANHALRGDGATVAATGAATQTSISASYAVIPNSATAYANMHGVGIIDILDYTSTSKNKTLKLMTGVDLNNPGIVNLSSGLWYATPTAITSVAINVPTGSWTTTSVFALYGIKGA